MKKDDLSFGWCDNQCHSEIVCSDGYGILSVAWTRRKWVRRQRKFEPKLKFILDSVLLFMCTNIGRLLEIMETLETCWCDGI